MTATTTFDCAARSLSAEERKANEARIAIDDIQQAFSTLARIREQRERVLQGPLEVAASTGGGDFGRGFYVMVGIPRDVVLRKFDAAEAEFKEQLDAALQRVKDYAASVQETV